MSLINKEIRNEIAGLFTRNSSFQVLFKATQNYDADDKLSNTSIFSYLNPVHAAYIHVVEKKEANYLHSLNITEQNKLIDNLISNHASHIVFTDKEQIPPQLLRQKEKQKNLTVILFTDKKQSAYHYLFDAIENIPLEKTSIHGSMVVIYNQGILITGDSGAGKSTLLLSLLDRGHLWVTDDAPDIYRNHTGQVFVKHEGHLPEYIHIKNIGPVNIDNTLGKAKRIPRHTLAAIIHLSNNAVTQKSEFSILTANEMITVLGKQIPKWGIYADQENRALLVESIAKQLILNSWGDNASKTLIRTHDTAIATQQNEI